MEMVIHQRLENESIIPQPNSSNLASRTLLHICLLTTTKLLPNLTKYLLFQIEEKLYIILYYIETSQTRNIYRLKVFIRTLLEYKLEAIIKT